MLREPIAQSSLAHIGRCPRKWYYAVERGLQQRGSAKPMMIGTLFHLTMAAGNQAVGEELAAGVPPSEAFTGSAFLDAARPAVWGARDDRNGYPLLADPADRTLAMEMVELYFEHIGSKRRYAALLGADDPVVIECEGMRIRCTLDAAWRTTSGSHDVEEYKTIATLPQSTDFLSLNFQRQAYHYAAVQMYGAGGQVLYMFQRREVPPGFGSRPLRMNKNGSVAKNNASQDRDDYMRQVAVPKSPEAIARFERNVREKKAAVRMYRASGVWPRVPIMSGNESCDKCPYFKLCDAEANGLSLSADALRAEYYHSPVAGRDQEAFAA